MERETMGELDGLGLSQLIQALPHMGFSAHWAAAAARIGREAPRCELAMLAELLRANDKEIREGVAVVMARIGTPDAIKLLVESALDEEDDGIIKVAVSALMHMREAAVDLVKEVMVSNSGVVRVRAALILAEIGNAEGIPILIDAVVRANELGDDILPRVIRSLGQLGDPAGVQPLIGVLTGPDWLLRPIAGRALVAMGESAVPDLLDVVRTSQDWDARCRAVEALGQIGSTKAAQPLVELMVENEGFVQYQIVEALGRIGDPRSIGALIQALATGDPTMRFRAGAALVHMGPLAADQLSGIVRTHPSADVRRSAAEALGWIGTDWVVSTLIDVLSDANALVRRSAVEALGRIKDRRAVDPLCHALRDENWFVARGAADALAQIKDLRAVGPLLQALDDPHSDVRRRIVKALESFGPLVEILAAGMAGGSTRTRLGIIDTLAGLSGPKVVDTLFGVLGDPAPEVRLSAATALAAWSEGDVHRRLQALADNEGVGAEEVRQALRRRAGTGSGTAGTG
jgi:HEAT repeat protein